MLPLLSRNLGLRAADTQAQVSESYGLNPVQPRSPSSTCKLESADSSQKVRARLSDKLKIQAWLENNLGCTSSAWLRLGSGMTKPEPRQCRPAAGKDGQSALPPSGLGEPETQDR